MFEFDDLKLDLAKFSYDYTFDIDNYHLVIELLDFDSSKNSLTDYIKNLWNLATKQVSVQLFLHLES